MRTTVPISRAYTCVVNVTFGSNFHGGLCLQKHRLKPVQHAGTPPIGGPQGIARGVLHIGSRSKIRKRPRSLVRPKRIGASEAPTKRTASVVLVQCLTCRHQGMIASLPSEPRQSRST